MKNKYKKKYFQNISWKKESQDRFVAREVWVNEYSVLGELSHKKLHTILVRLRLVRMVSKHKTSKKQVNHSHLLA